MKNLLHKTLLALLYLLPAALFFSYHPVISLGATPSMNLELSLPLIWLVLFDLTAFITLFTLPKTNLPGISDRRIFLFSLLPFFLTLSVFWSPNPLRGLLTAGIVWLLFFAIFAIIFILPLTLKSPENSQSQNPSKTSQISIKPRNLKTHLLLSLFISTAAVCIFCFIQSILDTCGLPRTETLLCAGCTYRSFGFPHPSGFAIEPQFMGNLLLAPTLTALYLLIFRNPQKILKTANKPLQATTSSQTPKTHKTLLTLAALLFATTLFFTFSRGAIYAFAVALLILLIFALLRRQFRPSLIVIPVAAFLLSLGLQGTFAALGPTSETFTSAVTKSIHQLSLGLIDLRPLAQDAENLKNTLTPAETPETDPDNPAAILHDAETDLEQEIAHFEGYVAESTNIRLNLNSVALATALRSPETLLFGVGLGGAGTAMHAAFPEKIPTPKEIVQNQTFSLLLETGLVGLFLVHFTLLLAFLAPFLPARFIDGRAAKAPKNPPNPQKSAQSSSKTQNQPFLRRQLARLSTSPFWSHPALPLLASLVAAYLVTLNFFSGLPNALQIYLMPPLLFFIFRFPDNPQNPSTVPQTLPKNSQ